MPVLDDLLLRKAHPADIESILDIEERGHIKPWSRQGLMVHLDRCEHTWFWCLSQKGKSKSVFGYICFRILFEECYLLNIAVAGQWQRRGLGSFLLNALLAFTKRRGIKRIVLDVHKENNRAIAFYKRHGFSFACDPKAVKGNFCVMEMKSVTK